MSDVSICNMALGHLGARPITAIDEDSSAASYCNIFWDNTRDEVLREFPWNFADKSVLGAALDVPTVFDDLWLYAYTYPVDCVQLKGVTDDGVDTPFDFKVVLDTLDSGEQRRLILVNAGTAVINYTARIENTALWDAKFVASMALKLAFKLAVPVTKNAAIAQSMGQAFFASIPEAKVADFKEARDSSEDVDPWEKARFGG